MSEHFKVKIVLVGHTGTGTPGGLSRYQRWLAHQLQQIQNSKVLSYWIPPVVDQAPGVFHLKQDAIEEKELPIGNLASKVLERGCLSLAARHRMHFALDYFTCIMTYSALAEIRKIRPAVIHYIGTGRTWYGFPIAQLSRNVGARFTVWPAVHAYSWGDDII